MAVHSLPKNSDTDKPTKSECPNPTAFLITDFHDHRLPHNPDDYQWLLALLKARGRLYSSYYRYGEFWEEEPFVCPACKHATMIDFAENDDGEFYCKYCYTTWVIAENRLMQVKKIFDDDTGDELGIKLI